MSMKLAMASVYDSALYIFLFIKCDNGNVVIWKTMTTNIFFYIAILKLMSKVEGRASKNDPKNLNTYPI